jgi:hypothetical protein
MSVEHGYIPLGKFSSARDDILHFLCLSDWAEDSDGNSEAPTGYFWRISNKAEDVQMENTEFSSIMDEWLAFNLEVTDSAELRSELVGHFIVQAMDSGFVYVGTYSTEEAMIEVFTDMQNEYSKWDDQDADD